MSLVNPAETGRDRIARDPAAMERKLGKYDRLRDHLRRQKAPTHEMSFADIERRIGALLPKNAARHAWWEGDQGVQHRAWADLGYEARLIGRDRVRFVRQGADHA